MLFYYFTITYIFIFFTFILNISYYKYIIKYFKYKCNRIFFHNSFSKYLESIYSRIIIILIIVIDSTFVSIDSTFDVSVFKLNVSLIIKN